MCWVNEHTVRLSLHCGFCTNEIREIRTVWENWDDPGVMPPICDPLVQILPAKKMVVCNQCHSFQLGGLMLPRLSTAECRTFRDELLNSCGSDDVSCGLCAEKILGTLVSTSLVYDRPEQMRMVCYHCQERRLAGKRLPNLSDEACASYCANVFSRARQIYGTNLELCDTFANLEESLERLEAVA